MGDMGDDFRAFKEYKKEQKEKFHKEKLPNLLELLDRRPDKLTYEVKNMGEHYVVSVKTERGLVKVDLWPSTGKWIVRNKKKTNGNGIKNLLKYFKIPIENSAHFICSEQ
jgi:hypothetical protein